MLSDAGYEVLVAVDGEIAIEQAEYAMPDIILLDVMMPGINGFETCIRLKKKESTSDIPIIFMTAASDTNNKLKGFQCGAVDYITKPFHIEEVVARVHTHLALRKLQQKLKNQTKQLEDEIQERKRIETKLKKAHAKLAQRSKSRIRSILRTTVDAIITLDQYGRIETFNRAAERIFGYTMTEISGENIAQLMPTYRIFHNEYLTNLYEENSQNAQVIQGQRKDGSTLPIEVTVGEMTINGERMYTCIIRDVTKREQTRNQLIHMVTHDALTDLPNRTWLMKRLARVLKISKQETNYMFAVLFLDCDRFKIINDSLGHLMGDKLLIEISRGIQSCLGSTDTLARFGGDEFIILLENIANSQTAEKLAEDILQTFTLPLTVDGQDIFAGVSIGIAVSNHSYQKPDDILRDADIAMYKAKTSPNRGYKLFDAEMHAQAMLTLRRETALRHAWQQRDFLIYYQPIVDLKSQEIVSFEALVRWQHPTEGIIPPSVFVPIAEEIGLITPLGQWVLYEACLQLHKWRTVYNPYLRMNINLSTKQFIHPNLIQQIDYVLTTTGVEATALNLEITESMAMNKSSISSNILQKLKNKGIGLSIDDFGTGYSSLSYLHHLPVDVIKIDRSFISRIGPDDKDSNVAQSIINLAHNMGLKVVAEGIETKYQLDCATKLGAEYGQGYFFSRPLSQEQVNALLDSGNLDVSDDSGNSLLQRFRRFSESLIQRIGIK